MTDALRRKGYRKGRVLIETSRILNSHFHRYLLVVSGAQVELLRNLMGYLDREHSFVSEYQDLCYLTPTVEEWDSLQAIVADLEGKLMEIALGFYDAYVCVRDKKAVSVQGGTFTSGAWRTRDINDEQADVGEVCTVAGNQVTLLAGTYRCFVSAPAFQVHRHQARLYNVTDTSVVETGTSEISALDDSTQSRSFILGRFTLDATKVLEIQHRCQNTVASLGFGVACVFTDEIYTVAEFWRET